MCVCHQEMAFLSARSQGKELRASIARLADAEKDAARTFGKERLREMSL
jgi:hypothetical protein